MDGMWPSSSTLSPPTVDRVRLIACDPASYDPASSAGPPAPQYGYYHQRSPWKEWNDTAVGEVANETMAADLAAEVGTGWAPVNSCVIPVRLDTDRYTVTIYGIVSPAFVLLTLITNCLVCVVLMKPQMRNCTNALLVAMAISDTLTGVLPVPCFLYFYSTGPDRYLDYLPYDWCFAYYCLIDYLPTICHTASVWLTVALAAHRYVYVCHPGRAKRLCTMSNVLRTIALIYIVAAASQLCRFAEHQYHPVDVPPPAVPSAVAASFLFTNSNLPVTFSASSHHGYAGGSFGAAPSAPLSDTAACYYDFSPLVRRYQNVYFNVYYWFRIVCIHLVPCTTLVVLTAALVGAIRSARFRRQNLLRMQSHHHHGNHHHHHQHQHHIHHSYQDFQQRRHADEHNDEMPLQPDAGRSPSPVGVEPLNVNGQRRCSPFRRLRRRRSTASAALGRRSLDAGSSTTLMLVIVVGVFLLVEFPLAIMFIIMIAENTFNVAILSPDTSGMASLVLNLVTLVSYPVNFFIYCAMSEQFRRTFCGLFVATTRQRNGVDMGDVGAAGNWQGNGGLTMTTGRSCCGAGVQSSGDGRRPTVAADELLGGDDVRRRSSARCYVSMLPMRPLGVSHRLRTSVVGCDPDVENGGEHPKVRPLDAVQDVV